MGGLTGALAVLGFLSKYILRGLAHYGVRLSAAWAIRITAWGHLISFVSAFVLLFGGIMAVVVGRFSYTVPWGSFTTSLEMINQWIPISDLGVFLSVLGGCEAALFAFDVSASVKRFVFANSRGILNDTIIP